MQEYRVEGYPGQRDQMSPMSLLNGLAVRGSRIYNLTLSTNWYSAKSLSLHIPAGEEGGFVRPTFLVKGMVREISSQFNMSD